MLFLNYSNCLWDKEYSNGSSFLKEVSLNDTFDLNVIPLLWPAPLFDCLSVDTGFVVRLCSLKIWYFGVCSWCYIVGLWVACWSGLEFAGHAFWPWRPLLHIG